MGRGPIDRVTARSTFLALRRPSGRARNGPIQAVFSPLRSAEGRPQVAYAVSKRCGGAVQRNRIRRRLRAALEREAVRIEPGVYLVRTDPEVAEMSFEQLCDSLLEVMGRAASRSKEKSDGA